VILVRPGAAFDDEGQQSYTVNSRSKDDITRLFESLAEKGCPVENICFASPASHRDFRDEHDLEDSLERGVYSFLFICQALIKQKLESAVQLLYLYSGKPGEIQPPNEAVGGGHRDTGAPRDVRGGEARRLRPENLEDTGGSAQRRLTAVHRDQPVLSCCGVSRRTLIVSAALLAEREAR